LAIRGQQTHGTVRAWCGHNLLAGALIGLLCGVLNCALLWADETGMRAVASLVVSTAVGALVMLLVGLGTGPLLTSKGGRWVAAFLHGLVSTLVATLLVTSVLLRATTGGYVTLGAIEFGLAAEQHVLGAALGPFLGWTLGVVATMVGLLVAAVWLALRRAHSGAAQRLGHAALYGAPAALILVAVPAVSVPGLAAASPELAFVESFDEEGDPPLPPPGPEPPHKPRTMVAEPGAPLASGDLWRERARKSKGSRPNVLLLTLESVAVRHLGYAGYARETTPNLDRIAANSLRMRRAWTTATHSNYAQMAVLSSLFPRRGAGLDTYQRLDYPRVLYHDVFHDLGYGTATFSSQDENWQGMLRFQQTGTPTHFWHSPSFHGAHIDTGAERVVPDAATVEHALSWIGRQARRPWSLYLNLQVTHFPYKLPPGAAQPFLPTGPIRGDFSYVDFTKQDRDIVVNRYDNALRYVDEQIGRMADGLAERGMLDDTLWVITSDHGELFLEHGLVTHGRTLYDAEARVPLLVHWPKRIRSADAYEAVSHVDIVPTVLDLLEIEPHPAMQGKSFAGARPSDAPTGVFMNIQGLKSADALVCWPWKLVADRTARRVMLFNLEQDPEENDDRAGRDVRVASDMFTTLRAQMNAQVAYHKLKNTDRTRRYAPRLLSCPVLPGARRAEAPPADPAPVKPRALEGALPAPEQARPVVREERGRSN
jgi:arylsulfatase A-like enzyme